MFRTGPNEGADFLYVQQLERYLSFIKRTTQVDEAIKYFLNKIPKQLPVLRKNVEVNYLDVGCGHGNKTVKIIDRLKTMVSTVNTVAVDPSKEMLNLFQSENDIDNIIFENKSWEAYSSNEMFDLITSIHSFYYIDGWLSAVEKMQKYCKPSGAICIVLRGHDQVSRFKSHFITKLYDKTYRERTCDELCKMFEKNNIQFELDIVTSELNIEDCVNDTPEGRLLIEFLLRTDFESLSDNVAKDIRSYLRENSVDNHLIHNDGFIWI